MYSPFQLGLRYLKYYLTASNGRGHGMHSPFVFEFITQVLNDDREFYAYQPIENLRQLLLHDERELLVEDLGAGSRLQKTNRRRIKDIAKASLKPKKFGQLLFRIADHYAPGSVLELGTSLGITTAYLASAKNSAQVITMEGADAVGEQAMQNFNKLQLHNIQLVKGNFDDTLAAALQTLRQVDLCFVDGNHRYEPTVRYYRQLLPAMHDHSILIFDDIHWSREMEQAWNEIRQDERITISIDLFHIGLVFFRQENKVKQHFAIRF
ncbi:MAG: class I SAM-dependent methyltransferase [Chitinophagaceae bacterium]|nr:class I SAM-dependent methyltransferase [Chitinophagaceae bacterium]